VKYDYIDPETIRKTPKLRDRWDVIVFGPGGGQAAVEGTPMWRNPIPWKQSADMPNVGTWAQTDDTRIGMGLEGLIRLREFIAEGGVYIGTNSSAEFAITNNFSYGVAYNRAATATRVDGSLLRTKLADDASPIMYGVPDNLAVYSSGGDYLTVSVACGDGDGGASGRARGRRRRHASHRAGHGRRRGLGAGTAGLRGHQPQAAADAAGGAAVAVLDADRGTVEAQPGESDPAGIPAARRAAF
jgi:hypothetical protein